MLGKLIKHEFHATGRVLWVIYAAMALLSVFANFSMRGLTRPIYDESGMIGRMQGLMILVMVLWVLSLIFGMAATVILMVKRFHQNFLTDEGYLMFTLPVNVHQLVFSKLLVAAVWYLATIAVIVLCVGIAFIDNLFLQDMWHSIRTMLDYFTANQNINLVANLSLFLVEMLVLCFVGCAVSNLQFYSAMSIGYGFHDHKALLSVVAFFVQSTVLQIVSVVLLSPVLNPLLERVFSLMEEGYAIYHIGCWSTVVAELLLGALFYGITVWNLKHRLNLS